MPTNDPERERVALCHQQECAKNAVCMYEHCFVPPVKDRAVTDGPLADLLRLAREADCAEGYDRAVALATFHKRALRDLPALAALRLADGLVEDITTLDVFLAAYAGAPDGDVIASVRTGLMQARYMLRSESAKQDDPNYAAALCKGAEFCEQAATALRAQSDADVEREALRAGLRFALGFVPPPGDDATDGYRSRYKLARQALERSAKP